MSTNADIVSAVFQAIDDRRFEALGDYLAPDVHASAPGTDIRGLEAVGAFLAPFMTAFPDLRHQLDAVVVADDTVTVELTHVGTHTGRLSVGGGELEPTGRSIRWPGCHVMRLRDGKVVSNHLYYDTAELFGQLGHAPDGAQR